MEDYTLFNQTEGVYSYTFQCEKKDDCLICGNTRKGIWFRKISRFSKKLDKNKMFYSEPKKSRYGIKQ